MKKEAVNHTKMGRLMRRLKIQRYAAMGILECIWHLTAREAPRGDIGRLSNEDIGSFLEYEGNVADLIEALIDSRWLDRSDSCRFMVHDWADHCMDRSRWGYNRKHRVRWERLKLIGGDICRGLRNFILDRDGRRCLCCGATVDLTLDHIQPISRGGTHAPWNLQTLCRSCNSKKGAR